MTELDHLIRQQRRSTSPQFFEEKSVPAEVLKSILENANWAPSHRQTEPWRFVVFQGAGKDQLADQFEARYRSAVPAERQSQKKVDKTRSKMQRSAAIIGIVMQRDPEERVPEWEEIAATAMAIQNLWLSLPQHGLGGYWSSPAILCSGYGLMPWTSEQERCLGLFYLGYAQPPELPRRRGDLSDKLQFIGQCD